MTTDIELAPTNPVAHYELEFSPSQIDIIKDSVAKGTTDDELAFFCEVAKRRGLDPLTKQIHAVMRYDKKAGREVMSIQTAIDGFRLIAQRTGQYAGRDPVEWCGPDGKWVDVWLADDYPSAARVTVHRKDWSQPMVAIAKWAEYVQTRSGDQPNYMWEKMGAHMLGKCAESLAIRAAFPEETSGIYTDDEMSQADSVETTEATAQQAVTTPRKAQVTITEASTAIRPSELTIRAEALDSAAYVKIGEWLGKPAQGQSWGTIDDWPVALLETVSAMVDRAIEKTKADAPFGAVSPPNDAPEATADDGPAVLARLKVARDQLRVHAAKNGLDGFDLDVMLQVISGDADFTLDEATDESIEAARRTIDELAEGNILFDPEYHAVTDGHDAGNVILLFKDGWWTPEESAEEATIERYLAQRAEYTKADE